MRTNVLLKLVVLHFVLIITVFAQPVVDQTVIDKQLSYFTSQLKKYPGLPSFSRQITVITNSQFELQKPISSLSFDCGYLDVSGNVYVSEPTTASQKKYFTTLTEAALFYLNQAFIQYFFDTDKIPYWYKVGFAAYEADLKIDDALIKSAINKYGGTLPSFAVLNDKAKFDLNDGIAISYLWGELMNVVFGWWKYIDVESINADTFVMGAWTKSTEEMHNLWKRYSVMRILEADEKYRIKFQSESEHFKFYYRDAENYCFPYMQVELEKAYTQYSSELKLDAPKKLTYLSQPECEGAKLDSVPCAGRYTGGTAWSSGLVTSCADKTEDLPSFRNLVRHELAHTFQFLITPNYMPAWLSEGFASFLPDGIMSDQTIRNLSGEVNCRMAEANIKLGHNPTITEFEDYGAGINYYLFGLIMNDFIARNSGYEALKNIVKSIGQDFSSMGYSSKLLFQNGFYAFYNSTWNSSPKLLTINKVIDKPIIDGKLTESTWQRNIVIDRKFWMDYYMNVIPTIDNKVTASLMYDDENLYLGFDVIDASVDGNQWIMYQNDGLEIDIDPDLSRGIDFKQDDMAFIWNIKGGTWYRTSLTGAVIASSLTSTGYNVEIAIPWSKLNYVPAAGKKFGLELCNYDRDNNVYSGALIYSGHSWNNGISLNGLAEVTLSNQEIHCIKTCNISSPTNGEKLYGTHKKTITWSIEGISKVNIEYSSDNGKTWNTIQTNVEATIGQYDWNIPQLQAVDCYIKITDTSDPTIYDLSEPFSVNSVSVISPNGGESWTVGSIQTIKWLAPNFDKIRIAYSTNNGTSWTIIADNLDASLSTFDWQIPDKQSQNCLIIVDSKNPTNNDKSDAVFTIVNGVGVDDLELPNSFKLSQNYPNPFNPSTNININLPRTSFVDLRLFDATGKEVKVLLKQTLSAGIHNITINASDLSSGIYFYQITTEGYTETKKLILMK